MIKSLEYAGNGGVSPHATLREVYEMLRAQGDQIAVVGPQNPNNGLPFTLVIAIDDLAMPAFDHYRDLVLKTTGPAEAK